MSGEQDTSTDVDDLDAFAEAVDQLKAAMRERGALTVGDLFTGGAA